MFEELDLKIATDAEAAPDVLKNTATHCSRMCTNYITCLC